MTVVNAAAATEAINISLVSPQFTFAARDPAGINNANQYSFTTLNGSSDVQVTGAGIDFNGNPPAFGTATQIDFDLSNNNVNDVTMTAITGLTGNGAVAAARMTEITGSAIDFFEEVMSFNDTVTGSAFDDTVKGGGGEDTLTLGGGDDTGFGGDDDDALNGDAGDDNLLGEAGDDVINGGSGNDTVNGGTGADDLDGGTGDDIYIVDDAGDVAAEVAGGVDEVRASVSETLSFNLENLTLTGTTAIIGTGNQKANVILGNTASNVLSGLDDNDTITGADGNDTLAGGNGNDNLNGGNGNDSLNGGAGIDVMGGNAGNDTYFVDAVGDIAIEAAGFGTDLVNASISEVLDVNVENLTLTGVGNINGTGNALGNTITGNAGANVIAGGLAADTMRGNGGNDTYFVDNAGDTTVEIAGGGTDLVNSSISETLAADVENLTLLGAGAIDGTGNTGDNVILGNFGANILTGDDGADTLNGSFGADTLVGGSGADTLIGGAGADVFDFDTTFESGPNTVFGDTINGFDNPGGGAGDLIDLTTIDAIAGGGDDAFTFLGVIQAFPTVTPAGSLWLRDQGGNTVVFGNADANPDVELAITIVDGAVGPGAYSAADLLL